MCQAPDHGAEICVRVPFLTQNYRPPTLVCCLQRGYLARGGWLLGLQAMVPQVISCKKAALMCHGYHSFEEWASVPGHVYIGRDMARSVPGAVGSKWGNPFHLRDFTLEESLQRYEAHVRTTQELWNSLHELAGAVELGCWCKPEGCHGDVLVKLMAERGLFSGEHVTMPPPAIPHVAMPPPAEPRVAEGEWARKAKSDKAAALAPPRPSRPVVDIADRNLFPSLGDAK